MELKKLRKCQFVSSIESIFQAEWISFILVFELFFIADCWSNCCRRLRIQIELILRSELSINNNAHDIRSHPNFFGSNKIWNAIQVNYKTFFKKKTTTATRESNSFRKWFSNFLFRFVSIRLYLQWFYSHKNTTKHQIYYVNNQFCFGSDSWFSTSPINNGINEYYSPWYSIHTKHRHQHSICN